MGIFAYLGFKALTEFYDVHFGCVCYRDCAPLRHVQTVPALSPVENTTMHSITANLLFE